MCPACAERERNAHPFATAEDVREAQAAERIRWLETELRAEQDAHAKTLGRLGARVSDDWVGPCAHGRDPWTRCDECEAMGERNAQLTRWRYTEAQLHRTEATLRKCVEAIEAVCDGGFEHADHHQDDCPGDCESHAVGWLLNQAHNAAREALGTTFERERFFDAHLHSTLRERLEGPDWATTSGHEPTTCEACALIATARARAAREVLSDG